MTVVSSKEFVKNEDKYLDMAVNGQVFIQRGDCMFIVQNFICDNEPDIIFEPDDDFYRSIPIEDLRVSAHEHIHKLFATQ